MKIRDRQIDQSSPYVIAEIGSNHNGDFDTAMRMIKEAARAGSDAVKFQKRIPGEDYMKALYNAPYANEFSYGETYGRHREALDPFDEAQWAMMRDQAHHDGLAFIATPFSEQSAEFLQRIGVDAFKISSAGLRDIPLIEEVAAYGRPMIVSTGGGTMRDVVRAWDYITCGHGVKDVAFLHCVSTYPNTDAQLNLRRIKTLLKILVDTVIGFSSHHSGIVPLIIARSLGAVMFEVHFTLNRGQKGTDHGFSMEPQGLERLCQDIRRVEVMMGSNIFEPLPEELKGFVRKQGRAIHVIRPVKAGQILTPEDVAIKAPAEGVETWLMHEVVGKIAVCDISTADVLKLEMLVEQI